MKSDLSQRVQREFFEHQGEGPWTVIYDSVLESGGGSYGIYCALSDPERRDHALGDPGWDLTVTDGAPGFSQSWPDGVETATYHPTGGMNDDVEPLVLVREYYGASESTVELDQQFRLFHNLRYDPASGSYYKMNEDGTQDRAAPRHPAPLPEDADPGRARTRRCGHGCAPMPGRIRGGVTGGRITTRGARAGW